MPRKKPKKPKKPKKKDMALTVTANLTTFDDAESATPWSTGTLDPDFFVQGSNSVGFYMSKNARGSVTVNATDQTWATGDHLYFWLNSSVAAKMEAQSTGTTTASGVTVRVTLANSAYREWHVCGSDTWDGGWRCFVIDMGHTGTHLYASSGTFSSASQIASITYYFDLSNSGNIRNVPANCWGDVIRFGTGLQVHNTSAADPTFDFADIAAVDEAVANAYGIFQTFEPGAQGVFGLQGKLEIGDNTSTNHVDFLSNDETVVFLQRDGTDGFGLVADALYDLSCVGNSTGTDQSVIFGTKVGTGDSMNGRNGTKIQAGGANVVYSVDLSDANLHTVGWYGSTIAGASGGISVTGNPVTTFELGGCTFDACDQVDTREAVTRNCNFLNTVAVATSGALLWDEGEIDAKYCLFVNNAVGVEVPSLTADMAFVGMEFQGNTQDVRYEGTTDWDLQWSEASAAPSIQNASTGTLTATASVDFVLTNIQNPSEVTILDRDVELEDTGTGDSGATFGDAASTEKVGQSFQVTTAGKAERIRVRLWKNGSPTDNVRIRLVNGIPGSSELLVSAWLDGSTLGTTPGTVYEFDLQGKVSLATSTTYGIEIERSGSISGTDYYYVDGDSLGGYGSGAQYNYNGASWGSTSTDLIFTVMEAASENSLYHVESVTTGTTTYTHDGTVKSVEVLVASLNFLNIVFLADIGGSPTSQAVSQGTDLVYSNP